MTPLKALKDKKNVLVIDDDEDILNWFRMLEKKENEYTFSFLQDELEILRTLINQPPDLIFLDIYLTHINGKKLSEIIQIASDHHIPIIHISTQEGAQTGLSPQAFMRKPLERKAVDAKIRSVLKI